MPLKHKNSDEANKHTPKGFDNASNFSRLLRDEIGTSRYTRETILPPAINFVDGANVPPTTVLNDVYVLIDNGGGSVNANWGSASYNDWVRFNGTNWGSVTPTAGDVCYDQTAGIYKVFSTSWAQFIPDAENISNADLTFGANHYADLSTFSWTLGGTAPVGTEKISLQDDTLVKGSDTSALTKGFEIVDQVNASLWNWRNNGDLIGSKSRTKLIAQNNTVSFTEYTFRLRNSTDTVDHAFFGNGGEVFLGRANTITGTGDLSTIPILGESNTLSGSGSFGAIIGYANNVTAVSTGGFVAIGKSNTLVNQNQVILGNSNNLTGASSFNYSFGTSNVISAGNYGSLIGNNNELSTNVTFRGGLGTAVKATAQGAFVIGYGDSLNFANKLTNSVADSVAFGWNSTTPTHWLTSTGAILGGQINMAGLPTSSVGLSAGDLWNDAGTLKIV